MARSLQRIVRQMLWFAAAVLVAAPTALATDYSWNNSSGGLYENPNNWTPNGIPGTTDTATFGLNSTYTVQTTVQEETAVNFVAGNVTLATQLFAALLIDNGVSLPNATGGSSLTVGSSADHPFGLRTNYLDLENGAPLYVLYGCHLDDNAFGHTRAGTLNGTLLVSGSDSSLDVYAVDPHDMTHFVPAPPLLVGLNGGTGLLGFQDGAPDDEILGPLLIADDVSPGTGEVDVGGFRAGAVLTVAGNITMAAHNLAAQSATMFIDSTGSSLTQTIDESSNPTGITVGSPANGSAAIYVGTAVSGGTLSTGTNGLAINKTGAVIVGSSSTTGTLNANGDVTVDGGLLRVYSGSQFNVVAGQTLHIKGGGTADFKSFDINGTSVDFVAGSLSYAGNLLVGIGGLLGASLTLDADRQLTLTGTTGVATSHFLSIHGGSLHTGSLVNDALVVDYYGTLATGAATLLAGTELDIGLGGTTRNTQYGAVVATGSVSLAGTLEVFDYNGFSPALGNSFDILDWGARTGMFSSVSLPPLAADRAWDTSQLYTTGVISVVASGLAGDFNHNGVVDAADYVVWRNGLGSVYTQADYNVWRTHFGQTAGSGSGAVKDTAVPEPSVFVLTAAGILGLSVCRRYRGLRCACVRNG